MKEVKHQLLIDNWDGKNYQELSEITGYTPEYVRKLGRKLGLPHKRLNIQAKVQEPVEETNLYEQLDDKEMLKILHKKGYRLSKQEQVEDKEFRIDTSRFKGETLRFGVVSDTHIGSKFQQLTHLKTAYRFFKEQGIKDVLHSGDLLAGNGKVYRGQMYELFVHGADAQIEYAIKNYPKEEGIKTYLISGNHDLSFLSSDGLDIVSAIAKERDDFEYLGQYGAFVNFGKIRIYLHHGSGGVAYARSYKLQKLVEQLAPENKPHALFAGHWHITNILPMYRNVFTVACGCFESQTPFLRRLGLYPEIGFYIVEITLNPIDREDGTTHWESKFYPFYVPVQNDY